MPIFLVFLVFYRKGNNNLEKCKNAPRMFKYLFQGLLHSGWGGVPPVIYRDQGPP